MDEDEVIIVVDLDGEAVVKGFDELENTAAEKGKDTGEAFEKNLSDSLTKGIKKSAKETQGSISKLIDKYDKLAASIGLVVPVAIFLEKQFGTFSKLFAKVGLDLDNIVRKFSNLIETVADIAIGEKPIKALKLALGSLLVEFGLIDSKLLKALDTFSATNRALEAFGTNVSQVAAFGALLTPIVVNLKEVKQLAAGIGQVFFGGSGLFGALTALTGVSAGLALLAESLENTENAFLKVVGSAARVAAIFTGGLAAAISFLIVEVSDLAFEVGTKLVGFFQKAADSFNKAEQSIQIFEATVDSVNRTVSDAAPPLDRWNESIAALSEQLNFSQGELRKSAQEILLVGSRIGLVGSQFQELLRISAEVAKVNRKDLFETTVALVKALFGQSQAAATLGLKLNDAAVSAFTLKQGFDETFESLDDISKAQNRFIKLTKDAAVFSSAAAVASGSLADQNERLATNTERLTTALGEGARLIEDNRLVAAALNLALDKVSSKVFEVAGFFGALGARILQISGLVVKFTFIVFALTKALALLDVFLKSDIGKAAFARNIPLIGKSLNGLIGSARGAKVEIVSLNSLITAFSGRAVGNFQNVGKSALFARASVISFGKAVTRTVTTSIKQIARLAVVAAVAAAPFLILAAKIGVVIAALAGIGKIFLIIEERTKAFSNSFKIIAKELGAFQGTFDPVKEALESFANFLKTTLSKSIGLAISLFAAFFQVVTTIASKLPFGIISDEAKKNFVKVSNSLAKLRSDLKNAGFDFFAFGEEAGRGLASVGEKVKSIDLEALRALREEFEDFGKTDLEILAENLQERINLVAEARNQEIISQKEFEELQSKIVQDGAQKRMMILKKSAINASKAISKALQNGVVKVVQTSMAMVGKALVQGSFSFKSFVGTILGIIGDLLLQLSASFIAIGLGIEAIKASIVGMSAGPALAAGLALALLGGALKAFAASQGGETTGGVGDFGGGGLGGGGDFADSDFLPGTDFEEEEERTAVQVTIQGDVLDSEETGLRIVDILNEAFDKQGVTVRGNV